MRIRTVRQLLVAAAIAALQGCVSPTLYEWGHYEELVHASFAAPGKTPPEEQYAQLEEDVQKAAAAGKTVPPGVRAHMGYLLYQMGRTDEARAQFLAEKTAFPESAVFMDRLIGKVVGS